MAQAAMKQVKGRVAAGHTIRIGNPFRIVRTVQNVDGKEVVYFDQQPVEGKVDFNEGEEIILDEVEAARCRRIGSFKLPGEPDTRPLGSVPAIEDGHNLVRTVES